MTLKNQNMWTAVLLPVGTALQLGGFQSRWFSYPCFVLGGGLLLYSGIQTARAPGGFLPKWNAWWALRIGGKFALHDAARVAYEAARKNNPLWAHAAEKLGVEKSPAGTSTTSQRTSECTFRSLASDHQARSMRHST